MSGMDEQHLSSVFNVYLHLKKALTGTLANHPRKSPCRGQTGRGSGWWSAPGGHFSSPWAAGWFRWRPDDKDPRTTPELSPMHIVNIRELTVRLLGTPNTVTNMSSSGAPGRHTTYSLCNLNIGLRVLPNILTIRQITVHPNIQTGRITVLQRTDYKQTQRFTRKSLSILLIPETIHQSQVLDLRAAGTRLLSPLSYP